MPSPIVTVNIVSGQIDPSPDKTALARNPDDPSAGTRIVCRKGSGTFMKIVVGGTELGPGDTEVFVAPALTVAVEAYSTGGNLVASGEIGLDNVVQTYQEGALTKARPTIGVRSNCEEQKTFVVNDTNETITVSSTGRDGVIYTSATQVAPGGYAEPYAPSGANLNITALNPKPVIVVGDPDCDNVE